MQVTLVAYENLKLLFPFPDPAGSITDLLPQQEDLSRIRARNALKGQSCFFTYPRLSVLIPSWWFQSSSTSTRTSRARGRALQSRRAGERKRKRKSGLWVC